MPGREVGTLRERAGGAPKGGTIPRGAGLGRKGVRGQGCARAAEGRGQGGDGVRGLRGWERIEGPRTPVRGCREGRSCSVPGALCSEPRGTDRTVCDSGLGAPAMVSLLTPSLPPHSLPRFCQTAPSGVSLPVSSRPAPLELQRRQKKGNLLLSKLSFGLLLVRGHITCPGCGGGSAKIQGISPCRSHLSCHSFPLAGGAVEDVFMLDVCMTAAQP